MLVQLASLAWLAHVKPLITHQPYQFAGGLGFQSTLVFSGHIRDRQSFYEGVKYLLEHCLTAKSSQIKTVCLKCLMKWCLMEESHPNFKCVWNTTVWRAVTANTNDEWLWISNLQIYFYVFKNGDLIKLPWVVTSWIISGLHMSKSAWLCTDVFWSRCL